MWNFELLGGSGMKQRHIQQIGKERTIMWVCVLWREIEQEEENYFQPEPRLIKENLRTQLLCGFFLFSYLEIKKLPKPTQTRNDARLRFFPLEEIFAAEKLKFKVKSWWTYMTWMTWPMTKVSPMHFYSQIWRFYSKRMPLLDNFDSRFCTEVCWTIQSWESTEGNRKITFDSCGFSLSRFSRRLSGSLV